MSLVVHFFWNTVYYSSPGDGQTSCKVWLTSIKRHRYSNEAKTWNTLKFAGVPQTRQSVSAVSGPKFVILWRHVEDVLLFNKFFWLSIYAFFAKKQPNKVVQWCAYDDFLWHFCVLYFQRAACRTFQTCILNSHLGHTMCRSMVDIQSVTAEIRRGKKKKKKKVTTGQKDNGLPYSIGWP